MRDRRRAAAWVVFAGALLLAGWGAVALPAGAVDPSLSVSPSPATPGTVVDVTMLNWSNPCNTIGLGANASYIVLKNSASPPVVIDGVVEEGTEIGTIALPSDLALGTYEVDFSCETSLGNGILRTTSLVVEAGDPITTTSTTSTSTSSPSSTSTSTSTSTSSTTSSTTTSTSSTTTTSTSTTLAPTTTEGETTTTEGETTTTVGETTTTVGETTTTLDPSTTLGPTTTLAAVTTSVAAASSTSTSGTSAPGSVAGTSVAATPVAAQPTFTG